MKDNQIGLENILNEFITIFIAHYHRHPSHTNVSLPSLQTLDSPQPVANGAFKIEQCRTVNNSVGCSVWEY